MVHTEEELTHVKGFIGKAHAAQAEYQGKIRDLRSESRDARAESASLRKIANLKLARAELQDLMEN